MTITAEQDRIRCDEQWRVYCRDRMEGIYDDMVRRINDPSPKLWSFSIPHELSERLIDACALAGRTCKYEHEAGSVWGGLTIL